MQSYKLLIPGDQCHWKHLTLGLLKGQWVLACKGWWLYKVSFHSICAWGISALKMRAEVIDSATSPRSQRQTWKVVGITKSASTFKLPVEHTLGSQWVTLLLRDNPEALFKTKPKAKDKLVSMAGKAPCDFSPPYAIFHLCPLEQA